MSRCRCYALVTETVNMGTMLMEHRCAKHRSQPKRWKAPGPAWEAPRPVRGRK